METKINSTKKKTVFSKMTKMNVILFFGVLALFIAGCNPQTSTSSNSAASTTTAQSSTPIETVTVNADLAPVFAKTTVSGQEFSLQSNIDSNKPTVVYFMASTCTTCAKNWAAVNEVLPEYEGKIDFIAVSVDPTDTNEVLQELAKDRGFVFESVAGDPALAVEYEVFKQTAKFAIDSNGKIVQRHDGALSEDEWRKFFDAAIAGTEMDLSAASKDDMKDDEKMMDKETSDLEKAPVFDKTTISGQEFSLQSNIDSDTPTVVYFMASTCTTCAKNWAAVNEVLPEYEGKIDFIAVSVDPTDTNEVLEELAKDRGFVFESVAGDPALAVEYEVFKQTAKFAIDKDGNIVERHDGALSEDEWRDFFNKIA